MIVRPSAVLHGVLSRRALVGRDPVELAREVVGSGCLVAIGVDDPALVERIGSTDLAPACELTVRVPTLGLDAARRLTSLAADAGMPVALSGPAPAVEAVGPPGARTVVPADEHGAEDRCRALADGRVRLVARRRHGSADLSFVRCLNVLMAGKGQPGIAVSDPRMVAIAGERAAWNGRPSDSWELVMPYGELVSEQRRLVAAGSVVRVDLGDRS